jgi:hypothetical protein
MLACTVHGYRERNGHDLLREALDYLGRTVRREHGLIWLDHEVKVAALPSPFKPAPKFKPRKRKPRTAWCQDMAVRAGKNGLSISGQI